MCLQMTLSACPRACTNMIELLDSKVMMQKIGDIDFILEVCE
jgi:hypothetical protein